MGQEQSGQEHPGGQAHLSGPLVIEPEWIDYNGHLNMAYYMVLFDRASDAVFAELGMGPAYAEQRRLTTYTGKALITYKREIHRDTPIICHLQMLGSDQKRMHTWQELRHATDGWVAATCELITLHVDMGGPKVAPFPADIQANVDAMTKAHAALPIPDQAGAGIAMVSKPARAATPEPGM